MVRYVARMGEIRNAFEIFIGKHRPRGRPRYIWENNIRMDLKETG